MERNGRNDYPFAIWEDKNFEVPKVQWDTRSSFPLDLNKEERRAKDRVVNLEPRSGEESMRLEGIAIKRFAPIAAVEAQRLNWLDNDWHWVVHFHYSDIEGKKSAVTSVLLDGRIVR